MVAKRGSRVGAAAFAVGLSLMGPHPAGIAAADDADTDPPSPSFSTDKRDANGPGRRANGTRGRSAQRSAIVPSPGPAATMPRGRTAVPSPAATSHREPKREPGSA
nr:hypothetical protein [Mycobacterium sp.]